ncbi:hypothetical protein RPE78_07220 [Thioclava litoralis]|uniref:Uncharacterized protein n=1 Tax=Thioclava litoralis TaxID=3076557 RepID=A0ABZ1DUV3_9RHOB|nr:hypothetical protein RPE78_07220 [Thioclava sp. FTW29]
MSEAVSLIRRDGPWGWDAAQTRYLCCDGLYGEELDRKGDGAVAVDPQVLAFLAVRLAALPFRGIMIDPAPAEIGLVFAPPDGAEKARQLRAGLLEHLLVLPVPEGARLSLRPSAGFSLQNAALLVEMISEVLLDIAPAGAAW